MLIFKTNIRRDRSITYLFFPPETANNPAALFQYLSWYHIDVVKPLLRLLSALYSILQTLFNCACAWSVEWSYIYLRSMWGCRECVTSAAVGPAGAVMITPFSANELELQYNLVASSTPLPLLVIFTQPVCVYIYIYIRMPSYWAAYWWSRPFTGPFCYFYSWWTASWTCCGTSSFPSLAEKWSAEL